MIDRGRDDTKPSNILRWEDRLDELARVIELVLGSGGKLFHVPLGLGEEYADTFLVELSREFLWEVPCISNKDTRKKLVELQELSAIVSIPQGEREREDASCRIAGEVP